MAGKLSPSRPSDETRPRPDSCRDGPRPLGGAAHNEYSKELRVLNGRMFAVLVAALILVQTRSEAQVDISFTSVRAGAIRTQSLDFQGEGYLWSFYPELQVGGQLFRPYLFWAATWGYWSDGINEPLPIYDFVTYSQRGHILTARIGVRPRVLAPHLPIPISFFVGVAQHISWTTYIGGTDLGGHHGTNSTDRTTSGLFGLDISVPIVAHLNLDAEGLQFVPFGNNPIDYVQKNRRAFTLGITVLF